MNINLLLIIVILYAAFKVVDGYKKGMVKEIISLVSLIILCAVVALLANGISNYHKGNFFNVVVVVILMAILGIVHHLLGIIFFSAKVISKLPVLHFVNKLLGAVFGVMEVVFVLWTIYTLVMMFDMGAIEQIILSYTEESQILSLLYKYNWLAYGIQHGLEEFQFVPLSTL